MKISGTSNNSFQNKVLIDTFIEQISALQTDVGNLQIADDNLAQALATKANTADINTAVNTGTLTSTNGNIKTLKVQGTGSSATIENATIGTASIGTENVTQSNITNLEVTDVDAGTVRTGTLTVENDATISGNVAVQDVSAKDITSASVNTLNITTAEADVNKLEAQNAEVTGKLEVNDLEVNGTFSGVSNIESESVNTESITADTAEIETLDVKNIRSWVTQVMNQDQILNPPTPALGNVDTYTIELPRFDGVFLLSWEDADVVWSATVIGNGKSYGISWGARTEQNYITDLFQYNGKLYIRVNSNGKLKYAYSTTKEPDQIVIYRNMNGWTPDKSLEELCDELSHIQNVYSAGTAWLGPVYIPRLLESDKSIGAFNFKGSCTFADIPDFVDVLPGDVWNITNESYTDSRFVEGAGKPINAGDDIIAVVVEEGGGKFEPVSYFENKELSAYTTPILSTQSGKAILIKDYYKVYNYDGSSWTEGQTLNEQFGKDYLILPSGRIILFNYSSYYYIAVISDDDGITWTPVGEVELDSAGSWGSAILSNGDILCILPGTYVMRSTNNGLTWNNDYDFEENFRSITDCAIDQLTSTSDGTIFILAHGNYPDPDSPYSNSILFKSTDDGLTWSFAFDIGNQFGRILENVVSFENTLFIYVNNNTYYSEDAGSTWHLSNTVNGDPIHIEGHLCKINDTWYSNVGYSNDFGHTWTKIVEHATDVAKVQNKVLFNNVINTLYDTIPGFYSSEAHKALRWDKLSAGVNYDNFVTDNITATSISATSIKKNNSEVLTEANRTNTVTENSTDVLTSGGAYTALATKQDTLTFDNVPTENSDNPVKSGGVYSALNTKIDNSEKGAANGVATLDATGRVPYNQLPESAMEYKGTWDASTNTPTLTDGTGTNGDFYVVSTAGTVTFSAGRSITFYVNDRVIYDGTLHEWERLPAGEVRSVNGQTGDVTLSIPAAQVNSDWNASSGVAQILNKPALATVATSGSYNDLSNKPTIPTVVDTVADGNMNAVTSNAVYDYIDAAITQVLNTNY